jgi:hypothetical protein
VTGRRRVASGRAFGATLLVVCLAPSVPLEDGDRSRVTVRAADVDLPSPSPLAISGRHLRATQRRAALSVRPIPFEQFDAVIPEKATPWLGPASAGPPDAVPPPLDLETPAAPPLPSAPLHALPGEAGNEAPRIAGAAARPETARAVAPAAPDPGLRALYVGFGVLQGLDVYTTRVALKSGAREANPLMVGLAGRPAALVAAKAAATFGTVYLVERLRVRNRVAAVVTMAAIDSAYAMLVVRNARVAGGLRERLR